ncbi:MAG: hypothetical protein ACYTF0_01080 [Planctomycetota bacterium]|jgi:hypothetical protein
MSNDDDQMTAAADDATCDQNGDCGRCGGSGGGGGGCLKFGCIAIVLLLAAGGLYLALQWKSLVGGVVVASTEVVVEQTLQLPAAEQEAVMRPLRELVDRFEDGEVDAEDFGGVLENLAHRNEGAAVMLRGFETRYVADAAVVAVDEQEAAGLTVNRFANGLLDGRIDRAVLDELGKVVATQDAEGNWTIKEELSAEDVAACLQIMGGQVEAASITDPRQELDLEALMREAIGSALEDGSAAP